MTEQKRKMPIKTSSSNDPKRSTFYSERIKVETADQSFYPTAFTWHEKRYAITQIVDSWQDWGHGSCPLNKKNWRLRHHRNYFIVQTNTNQVFKIYHDRGVKKGFPRIWILNQELLIQIDQEKPIDDILNKEDYCYGLAY